MSAELVVQKYGGATLATSEHIVQVAKSIAGVHQTGCRLVVVVSAMGQTTNELIRLASQVAKRPQLRELDMLLTTGERVAMSLLTMALNDLGVPAVSLTGSQAGILTDDNHLAARIRDIRGQRILDLLNQGQVVIVAGFQGVSPVTKEITTLGRGGSDTTAVALAHFLNATRCEIIKDVPGVLTGDPKLVPNASRLEHMSALELVEYTFWGAKMLHSRSAELVYYQKIPLYFKSSADPENSGTYVFSDSSERRQTMAYETERVTAITSIPTAIEISFKDHAMPSLARLQKICTLVKIPFPQVLEISGGTVLWTSAQENLASFENWCATSQIDFTYRTVGIVTILAQGAQSEELLEKIERLMHTEKFSALKIQVGAVSLQIFLKPEEVSNFYQVAHLKLITS